MEIWSSHLINTDTKVKINGSAGFTPQFNICLLMSNFHYKGRIIPGRWKWHQLSRIAQTVIEAIAFSQN